MYVLIPLLNLLGLELVYLKYAYLIYFVSIVMIVLTVWFIYHETKRNQAQRFPIIVSLVLFFIAHYLFLLFLEGFFLVHGFIFLVNFVLFILLYSFYDKNHDQRLQLRYALENILGYFNLVIFFFLSVDVFYLDLSTNQKFIWFLSLFMILALALSYSSLKISNLISVKAVWYLGIFILIMIEIFWLCNLLPISVYSKAAVVSICYYLILGLSKHYLFFGLPGFSPKLLWRYLTISVSGTILVLLTSRW